MSTFTLTLHPAVLQRGLSAIAEHLVSIPKLQPNDGCVGGRSYTAFFWPKAEKRRFL